MNWLLYEVSLGDPLTYGAISTELILGTALASSLPARSATKVEPVKASRPE
jgi:ABC-type lipoprotein release transport system permease subunit